MTIAKPYLVNRGGKSNFNNIICILWKKISKTPHKQIHESFLCKFVEKKDDFVKIQVWRVRDDIDKGITTMHWIVLNIGPSMCVYWHE